MCFEEYLGLANGALYEKRFQEAAKYYSVIIDSNKEPFPVDIYNKRCQCYYSLEIYDKALADAVSFSKKCDDPVLGFLWKGKCLTKLKQFNEAYIEYKKGLQIEPQHAEIADDLRVLHDAIMMVYETDMANKPEGSYDAVELCSQEPYPGDEELQKLEREIMTSRDLNQPPNITQGDFDLDMAADELTSAIVAKELGQLEIALTHVNKAGIYNPDSQFMLEERADILFQLGEYKEAFRSCNRILFEFRTATMWTLGGKILDALSLPVTSETWLRMATQLAKGTESEAPLIFQKVRVKRLYEPLSTETKVFVTFTQFGRSMMTKESINKGDILLQDRPVVCAQTIDSLHIPACGLCATSLIKPEDVLGKRYQSNNQMKKIVQKYWPKTSVVPCRHCNRQIYCSVECQEEAWERYHCLLCPEVNQSMKEFYKVCDEFKPGATQVGNGWWNASFSPMILLRIWASIVCSARRFANAADRVRPSLDDWTQAKALYRRFIAYAARSNVDSISLMYNLMVDIFKDLGDGLSYTITRREFDGRYYQASCNVQSFSDLNHPLKVFLKNIKDKPNTRGILLLVPREAPEAEFGGLFVLHACMNHSCMNTVEVMDGVVGGRPGVVVRAKRNMESGEEVLSTYINTAMPRVQRRAWLHRAYNFWCNCDRCTFEGDGPQVCTQCKKQCEDGKMFPTCSRCKKAWYCSAGCQKVAWKKGHKKICSMSHSNTTSSSDCYVAPKK